MVVDNMKNEEDEAFDDLAKRQGMWGGGFPAKRAMAVDKLLEDATRSCNNIDEQRALDALMREAQPAQDQDIDAEILRLSVLEAIETFGRKKFALMLVQPEEPAQEPMATVTATVTSETGNPDVTMSWWHEPALPVGTKLYTTPPKRPWVGLMDEQRLTALKFIDPQTARLPPGFKQFAESIEQLLKEKNA